MSNGELDLVFHFRVKPGMEDRYQQAMDRMLPVIEVQEPYVLAYNIYRNGDGLYTQHERYVDEDAMWRHLEVTAQGQEEWAAATAVEDVTVLGDVSEKFWEVFGAHGPRGFSAFRKVAR